LGITNHTRTEDKDKNEKISKHYPSSTKWVKVWEMVFRTKIKWGIWKALVKLFEDNYLLLPLIRLRLPLRRTRSVVKFLGVLLRKDKSRVLLWGKYHLLRS